MSDNSAHVSRTEALLGSTRTMWLLFAVLAALSITPRVAHPTADPIMGPLTEDLFVFFTDEGWIAQNARNRVLLGKWSTCRNNPIMVTPGMTLMQTMGFSAFGVSIGGARALPIAMSVGCWLLLGLILVRIGYRRDWLPLLALFFLGLDQVDAVFSRTALAEHPALFFALAGLLLTTVRERPGAWDVTAGLSFGVACTMKALILPLGVAFVTAHAGGAWMARRRGAGPGSAQLGKAVRFAAGVAFPLAIWAIFMVFADEILGQPVRDALKWYADGRVSVPLADRVYGVLKMLGHQYLWLKHPFETLAALIGLAVLARRLWRSAGSAHVLELTLALWFILQLGAESVIFYQPTRWLVLAGVPLAFLAALGVRELLLAAAVVTRRTALLALVPAGALALYGWRMVQRPGVFSGERPDPPPLAHAQFSSVITDAVFVVVLATTLLLLARWLLRRAASTERPLSPWLRRGLGGALLGLHAVLGLSIIIQMALAPEFTFASARELVQSTMKDGDVIVSEFADNLFLDKKVAVVAFTPAQWASALASQPEFASPSVTHVLVNPYTIALAELHALAPHRYTRDTLLPLAEFPLLHNWPFRGNFLLLRRTDKSP